MPQTSKLPKTEVSQARIGPRDLKDPRSREYAIQTLYALKRYVKSKECDEKLIADELERIRKYRHWEILGYQSEDELLETEVGLNAGQIKERAQKLAQDAKPLAKHGEVGRGRNRDNDTISNGRGASYLAARLRRDAPEICDRLAAGEFPSVRAAAIEAGIVKVPTAFEVACKAYLKLDAKDRRGFAEWIQQQET